MSTAFRDLRTLAVLGGGRSSRVYLVQRESDGQRFALKQVSFTEDSLYPRERLLREVEVLSSISHPSLVRLVQAWTDAPDHGALLLEYVEGPTLAEKTTLDGALAPEAALELLCSLASVLAVFHEKGYIHRDLSPWNVILPPDRPAVLVDPGLCADLGSGLLLTDPAAIPGTAGFVAPELISGACAAGPAADVYSLGMIYYFSVNAGLPWKAPSDLLLFGAQVMRPAQGFLDRLPAELRGVAARMLAQDCRERFRNAGELYSALMVSAGA